MIIQRHDHRPGSRLWLALRCHKLPLEVLCPDATAEKAMVVTEKQRVIYVNATAYEAGVRYGLDVTTAQLLSHCESYLRDGKKEAQALAELSAQLYQFTPHIQTYQCQTQPHAGLLLEISSCLQLFGGVRALTSRLFHFLTSTPYTYHHGLAHTAKGAWLLSFAQTDITGTESKEFFCERIKSLPVQLLHDFPEIIDALEKTGFKTLGDITRQIDAQKITAIKKRFGADFAAVICDIFAIEQNMQQHALFEKPLTTYQPTEFFSETIQFDYPVSQNHQLFHPAEHLLQNLSQYLRKRQQECQHIQWTFSDIYRNTFTLSVHSDSPESHWELLYDLTVIQLDNRELPFEVDSVTLTCRKATPVQNRSQTLSFDSSRQSRRGARHFAITMAKLKARLGDAAVFKVSYQDALLPEASNACIAINETANQHLPHIHQKALRPAWLLPSPQIIEERNHSLYWRGKLTLLAGPERIHSSWWQNPNARDYFIAQRHDHVRLWIFLDLHKNDWYVHGIFG